MEKDKCLYKHSQKDYMMSGDLQINLLLLELNKNPDGELSYFSLIFFLPCNCYVVEISCPILDFNRKGGGWLICCSSLADLYGIKKLRHNLNHFVPILVMSDLHYLCFKHNYRLESSWGRKEKLV